MLALYNYWQHITSFEYHLGKKEARMFYIASVIPFSVSLELLWKSTLLVHYKLNRLRPPRVKQFDIHELLFDGYARFVLLDKIVIYS